MKKQTDSKEPWIKISFENTHLSGIEELDKEHGIIYALASDLLQVYLADPKDPGVAGLLKKIGQELLQHFDHEENYMTQNHFPGQKEHRQKHTELKAKADQLLDRYQNGSMNFGDLYDFLSKEMIQEHIGKVDDEFHEFIKSSRSQGRTKR